MNDIVALIYAYARAAWRRRWMAVTAAWLIAVPAWVYVLSLPDRYQASASMFVDARTPLQPVLEGIAIREDYDSQLSLVREALLSGPQLTTVAKKTGLDKGVKSPEDMDAVVSDLHDKIQLTSFNPPVANGQSRDTIYYLAYQNEDRDMSVKVVETLLETFREETLEGNRSEAGERQDFLAGQIAEKELRLQEAEEKLRDFKTRHMGMIPGERGDSFTRMDQEKAGLQQAETNLAVAISRRAELQRQLAETRPYLTGSSTAGGGSSIEGSLDVTMRRQEAEQRLEGLLQRFTARHPDVIALKKNIDELKAREAAELAELQRGGTGTGAIRSLTPNPLHQQIQAQLGQVQVEIASHQGQAQQHRREIANLQQFVAKAPEVEQEYARLNRDYGVFKEQYQQMVARREQAQVSDDAARTGIVRFEIIEPPGASPEPVWPKRVLLLLMVLVGAIGAGIGLAALPRLLWPTFDDIATLQRKLGVPVLGAVSAVPGPAHRKNLNREVRMVAFATGALLVLGAAVMITGDASARAVQALITQGDAT